MDPRFCHPRDVHLSLRPPSEAVAARVLAQDVGAELTYQEVGATVRGDHPDGYRYDRWETDLGPDDEGRFERCGEAVLRWAAQRGAGMRIVPDKPVALDLEVALVVPLPVGFTIATARVVHVVRSREEMGFAYGTLPAHPEQGEEIFVVRRSAGRVTFEVAAFSRPRDPLARLGGPVTRWLQVRTNRTYLRAIREIAA